MRRRSGLRIVGAAILASAATVGVDATADGMASTGADRPTTVRLGSAPPLAAGARRVVTGKLVALDAPPRGAVSIEVLLRSGPRAQAVPIGRFSPFPLERIERGARGKHQSFALPTGEVVPAAGGGDWRVEFRIRVDEAEAPRMRASFASVAFGTD